MATVGNIRLWGNRNKFEQIKIIWYTEFNVREKIMKSNIYYETVSFIDVT